MMSSRRGGAKLTVAKVEKKRVGLTAKGKESSQVRPMGSSSNVRGRPTDANGGVSNNKKAQCSQGQPASQSHSQFDGPSTEHIRKGKFSQKSQSVAAKSSAAVARLDRERGRCDQGWPHRMRQETRSESVDKCRRETGSVSDVKTASEGRKASPSGKGMAQAETGPATQAVKSSRSDVSAPS